MKKNLLVTLADKNYIDQAKQLFSSVYWNAGWKGDYMLLAHDIPEEYLKWFRDKGIFIKKCRPLSNEKGKFSTTLSKFYLFTSEFKKWKNIIYLDADIIVRTSLDELTKVKGFAASNSHNKLSKLFISPWIINKKVDKQIFNELKNNYNLKEIEFNSGVIAFSTGVIKNNTFSIFKKLLRRYYKIKNGCDEPIMNLLFYKQWKRLTELYNITPYFIIHFNNVKPEKVRGIILHFSTDKPWNPKKYFYKEWKHNLDRAELIDINKIPNAKKWTNQEIQEYSLYLKKRCIRYFHKYIFWQTIISTKRFTDRNIGLIGIFLKYNSPRLYIKLKGLIK